MAKLPKAIVQRFYNGLCACSTKSGFDSEFLRNSADSIADYDIDRWIEEIYRDRLYALRSSSFDWTRINQNGITWSGNQDHANFHWFELAKYLAEATGNHITKVLFPNIAIASADERCMIAVEALGALFYDDKFSRLILLDRVANLANSKPTLMASYDVEGNRYALSFNEMAQIYQKIVVPRSSGEVKSWAEFRGKFMSSWIRASKNRIHIEDLLYPLFDVVRTYFSELDDLEPVGETLRLLENFYHVNLRVLDIECVNYFHGQQISILAIDGEVDYLSDIIVQLMLHVQSDIRLSVPKMVKLAAWITMQNPAMFIDHEAVDPVYREMCIGPYIAPSLIAVELSKLIGYADEFSLNELELINKLIVQSRTGMTHQMSFFESFYELFVAREEYNFKTTYRDIGRDGIIKGSFEYVYHRIGANEVFIRLAQMLFALKIPQRYGIGDPYQLLMPELESAYDEVSGRLLSTYPLSHYVRIEKNRTYLALLDHAQKYFEANNQCFYNVHEERPRAFSVREYECIQAYSSSRFRQYPRLPRMTAYPLKAKTLEVIASLVNSSLYFDATQEGDGYVLVKGLSRPTQVRHKTVEYVFDGRNTIVYQIRDSWEREQYKAHSGTIVIEDEADRQSFIANADDDLYRLMYILNIVVSRGHARPNLSIERYFTAYVAYNKLREFCNLLRVDYVATLIRQELLPLFMNFYPMQHRFEMISRCSQSAIEQLLLSNREQLKLIISDRNAIAFVNLFLLSTSVISVNPIIPEPDILRMQEIFCDFLDRNDPELFNVYDPQEYSNLMNTTMRFGHVVRSFGEIWGDGFPDCMSIASKWFSILLMDHLPGLMLSRSIESDHRHSVYLGIARQKSQRLYQKFNTIEEEILLSSRLSGAIEDLQTVTPEIGSMLSVTDERVTRPQHRISRCITFFGFSLSNGPGVHESDGMYATALLPLERRLSDTSAVTTEDSGSRSSSSDATNIMKRVSIFNRKETNIKEYPPVSQTSSEASSHTDDDKSGDEIDASSRLASISQRKL